MGLSKIEIMVTGNHGCDRNAKEGETLAPRCDAPGCVDCRARDFVATLIAGGNIVSGTGHDAKLTHWPQQDDGGIVDDLVTERRIKGHF